VGAYRTYLTSPVAAGGLSPTFLQQAGGLALTGGIGDVLDNFADRVKMASQADMPLVAPADALTQIGIERQILRGPTESDAAFAVRCQNAWQTWPYAGTPFGLLLALYNLGYPNVYLMPVRGAYATLTGITTTTEGGGSWTIDGNAVPALPAWAATTAFAAGARTFPKAANGYWYTTPNGGTTGASAPVFPTTIGQSVTDAGGVTWTCSGTDFWSRFDVVFSPVPASWNPTPPGATSDEVNRIRLTVAQWKPAFATVTRLIALVSGRLLGFPARNLGIGNTLGSASITVWSP
jgi:hypothetical protein